MSRGELNRAAFRHGLRVRMEGREGPLGTLLACRRRDGSGTFWKVRLDSGEWVWPDGMVIDGPGLYVGECVDCHLPMFVDAPGATGICPGCDEDAFGTRRRATEPAGDDVARRNWTRRREAARRLQRLDESAKREQRS